jgi:transposase-like protein
MPDELLPGLLGEIAEAAGISAALAMAERVGGTRVNIPARARDDHWLVEIVGRSAADKICDHFRTLSAELRESGARHIVIPRGSTSPMAKVRRKLICELESGASAREAARRVGVSERTAFRMRARLKIIKASSNCFG